MSRILEFKRKKETYMKSYTLSTSN